MTSNEQPPNQGDGETPDQNGLWDPNEQIGDNYEVGIGPDGIRHAELRGDRPRIWIGSLSDYNNGILHGEWIDAAREPDEIHADIAGLLAASPTAATDGTPAEEWGIFDFDNFAPIRIGEYDRIEVVSRIARGIAEHGPAYAAWADITDRDQDALEHFDEMFIGRFDSAEAYVEQLVEDVGYEQMLDEAVPDHVRPYVKLDVPALARDLQLDSNIHVAKADSGGVWIFDGTIW
ncbi:MAG: antirestriction protein ArdA [Pseudonocardiales bacterium]|nr:MAG: antirestriction protein ArdA [Pseudonocardiales bacterium]